MSYDYDRDRIREYDDTGRLTAAGFSMPVGRYFRNAMLGHLAFWSMLAGFVVAILGGFAQIGMTDPPSFVPFLVVAVVLIGLGVLVRRTPRRSLWYDRALVFQVDGTSRITPKGSPFREARQWRPLNIDHRKIVNIELAQVGPVPKGYAGFGQFLRHGAGAFPFGVRAILDHGGDTLLWYGIAYQDDATACTVQLTRALQEIREAGARVVTLE